MQIDLQYDNLGFYDIEQRPGKYLKIFYKLQRFNELEEIQNFAILPIFKHGRHHVTIDATTLSGLLIKLKKIKPSERGADKVVWDKWLKYHDLERGKKFHGSIKTDGVSVSWTMDHNTRQEKTKVRTGKKQKEELKADGNINKMQREKNNYTIFIGLDPGMKLMVGGVKKTRNHLDDEFKPRDELDKNRDKGELIKITSKDFHKMTGAGPRKSILDRLTANVEREAESDESPKQKVFKKYTKHRLEHFEAKQRVYEQQKNARLKFDKYVKTEKAAHQLSKDMIGQDEGKTLIIMGGTTMVANSPMRGSRRVNHPKLLRALSLRADVLVIDEFRTTMLCSKCYDPVNRAPSPHRYQFCPNCRKY